MMGKFALAEDMDLKAVRIREIVMPGSDELAASYADAGMAAAQRGDFSVGLYRLDKARVILAQNARSLDVLSGVLNDVATDVL